MGIIKKNFNEIYEKVRLRFGEITDWEITNFGKEYASIENDNDFLYSFQKDEVKVFLCPHCFSSEVNFYYSGDYDDLMRCDICKSLFTLEEATLIKFRVAPTRENKRRSKWQ